MNHSAGHDLMSQSESGQFQLKEIPSPSLEFALYDEREDVGIELGELQQNVDPLVDQGVEFSLPFFPVNPDIRRDIRVQLFRSRLP